jgi:hypothetical protein
MSEPSSSPSSSSTSLPQFPIELTDADATLQVHAMVPKATDTEQELGDDDLVADEEGEDIVVEVAPPFSRAPVPIPRPPPTLPHRRSLPSSIGPVAIDVGPLTPPPPRRRADSTVLLPRVSDDREKRLLLLVAAAAALAVVGLGSLGMTVAYSTARATAAASTTTTVATAAASPSPRAALSPRVAAPKEKELLATISVLAAPEPSTGNASAAATSNGPAATSATSTPPTLTSVAASAPTGPRTGILRVPPSIHGILVDGRPRRVDGSTVVSCGRHAIKTGIAPSRVVEIPCGGTAYL